VGGTEDGSSLLNLSSVFVPHGLVKSVCNLIMQNDHNKLGFVSFLHEKACGRGSCMFVSSCNKLSLLVADICLSWPSPDLLGSFLCGA
jgi:hypothetical protein